MISDKCAVWLKQTFEIFLDKEEVMKQFRDFTDKEVVSAIKNSKALTLTQLIRVLAKDKDKETVAHLLLFETHEERVKAVETATAYAKKVSRKD